MINLNNSIIEFISQVQNNLIEAQRHQDLPFEKLVDELQVEKDRSRHPIFQVMFGVQAFGSNSEIDLFKLKELNKTYSVAKFDITCFMDDSQKEIKGSFNFATSLYEKASIKRMANHYLIVLDQMVSDKYKQLREYTLLTQAEYQQIVIERNKTDRDYPKDKTIHQLFEEQVLKTPDNIAVVFEDQQLTYRELNQKANQVANYIQTIKIDISKKQTPNDNCPMTANSNLIALCLDRSLEMIISILGIMKAGGAYVPIDPEYPAERIRYILVDTQSELVLTQSHLVENLQRITNVKLIELDSNCYQVHDTANLLIQNKATDLAYVIYTSGTTGKPKGVSVEHTAIVNRVLYMIKFSKISYLDTYMFKTNYVFDVSVSDIFSHILAGANIIITRYTFSLVELKILLNLKKITSVHLVPSQYDLIVSYINKSNINKIYFSGEKLTKKIIDRIPKKIVVYNYYGPTELGEITSIVSNGKNTSSIGNIFPCNKAYVLNKSKRFVPQGVIGELHISGAGLARGYLNKLEQTAENFISNPFATKDDIRNGYTRLYTTGDLVRWLPDGNLEYIGRNDFQIKIRGYRIELGEIESVLTTIKNIKQACVLAKENNGNKYLVAYFVTENSIELQEENILKQLSEQLPDYMVPSVFVKMEDFPLTINGKLDRKALPVPEFTNETSYIAPTTDLEIKLCDIWQEVLNLGQVGVTDDFFRIGGESILAIKLSHQISKELDVHIAVADIFKYKTVSRLIEYLNSNETENIKITPQNLNKYPLSFAQERLWFIEQYEQGTNAYHIPMLVELKENIDKDKLKNSIQQIIQRHEVLRTIFKQVDGEYYQVVVDDKLKINEYSHSERDISKQIAMDINTPFDLEKDFPIRVSSYHKESRTYLLENIHHIASDGWSLDILLKEINNLYDGKDLLNPVIQYKDFAHWQREYLQGAVLQNQLNYWKKKLQGYEALALPTDKARSKQIDYTGDDILFQINEDLSNALRDRSKEHGCTMYTMLLSGFYILLNKYTSQNDIVLGTAIANRHYTEIQDLIGFFVNSLALREKINLEKSIVELIYQVQNNLIEAQRHQDLPFEKLVEELKIEHDTSRHPIFQVMFGVQSFGSDVENRLFKPSALNNVYSIAKCDLSCFMDDSQKEIQGLFNFATALYEKPTIERMVKHYLIVLEQMVGDKYKQIKEYSLLSPTEYQQIVIEWNKTDKKYPKDRTIYQLFEEQVLKTPDNIAVIFSSVGSDRSEIQQLTYLELNAKANQLARYLQTQTTINADTLITLCLDRSLEMIIGILGIMKAGGAYVPIDPEYPGERISYILEDTQTELLLTQSHLVERLQEITDVKLIELDSGCFENQETTNLAIQNKSTDLAYVIYTSGTTGKPKGACLSHQSLNNLVINQIDKFNIKEKDNVLLFASLIFDASISEVFTSIVSGACLNIIEEENRKSSKLFITYLVENNINVATLPPVFLSTLEFRELNSLKTLVVAGESCPENLMKKWNKGRILINAYGPTENTVCATMHEYIEGDLNRNIGKPLNNIRCYVLNAHNKPVPIGVIGELYIKGEGQARGYLNQPELTAGKFIPSPFATKDDIAKGYTRLYKTGDLVRWLPDGNLEYIGRNDFQIKIRGYRIEPSEIEKALACIENIKQACVIAKEKNGSKYLTAYYVLDTEITEESIVKLLSKQIPDYMVPSTFVKMETFPLTINGKLDRKALPDPEFTNKDTYLAPTTDLEIKLCNIWQEVLNLEKVSITDDFFRIGGDSILSIQLSSKLRNHDLNYGVRDIFDNRTVRKLAKFIESDINKTEIIAEQGILEGKFDLLPIQKWFFDKVETKQFKRFNHWNQSFMVKVPKLETVKLQPIIQKLTEQHDILRVVFNDNQQEYLAKIDVPKLTYLNIENLSEQETNNSLTNLQANFDLYKAPLCHIAYIEGYEDNSARLFFALHHLIVDAVSWKISIEDFKSLYNNENLGNKFSSYRQWVDALYLYAEKNPEEKEYWNDLLKTVPKYEVPEKETALSAIKITKELTATLLQHANEAYHTEVNDLLLTALALSLQKWNKVTSQAITLEGHGREIINKTIDHNNVSG